MLCKCAILTWGLSAAANAQCEEQWQAGKGIAGANSDVFCSTLWDPDGPGPQPSLLVMGGAFNVIGPVQANHIAAWNPETDEWYTFGSGLDSTVWSLAALANGDLVVGGTFLTAGDEAAQCVARWDGNSWHAMGLGMDASVRALLQMPNGDVVAGGTFLNADEQEVNCIARWDGTNWQAMGGGFFVASGQARVNSLVLLPNGQVCAGGAIGGGVRTWTGTLWRPLGTGLNTAGYVNSMVVRPDGSLAVTGGFTSAGGVPCNGLASWNGTAWSAVPSFPSPAIGFVLANAPNGDLIAGGGFQGGPMRWDGAGWFQYGSGWDSTSKSFSAITPLLDSRLWIGGSFASVGPTKTSNTALWDRTAWRPLNIDSTDDAVFGLRALPSGTVVATGPFTRLAGVPIPGRLARRFGDTWESVTLPPGTVATRVAELSTGELTCIGVAPTGGYLAMRQVGTSWTSMGLGSGSAYDLAVTADDQVVFARESSVAIWNGASTLTTLGESFNSQLRAVAVLNNGDIVAVGNFTSNGGSPLLGAARWNGTTWSQIGTGLAGEIDDIEELPDGRILVCGNLASGTLNLHGIGVWDGSSWQPFEGGADGAVNSENKVAAIAIAANGDVLVAGSFTSIGGQPASRIARWDGHTWNAYANGIDGVARAIATADGITYVGGDFYRANGDLSYAIARWSSSDPPVVSSQPESTRVCRFDTASFEVLSTGTASLSYQWQWRAEGAPTWLNVNEGPNYYAFSGGPSFEAANVTSHRIDVGGVQGALTVPTSRREFQAVVSNSCGSTVTHSATLTVCPTNVNCDVGVDIDDLLIFLAAFASGDSVVADLDDGNGEGSQDGGTDINDLLFFLAHFEAGC